MTVLFLLGALLACSAASAAASSVDFTELSPPYLPPTSDAGKSVVTGDFNRDGKTDIAFDNSSGFSPPQQNCPTEGCVSVLVGKGDATFTGPVNYPSDGNPYFGTASLAGGDLNGDRIPDLVVANVTGPGSGNCATGCVSILYGNGDGTFSAPVDLTSADGVGPNPEAVVIADLNGDGRPDIAVGNGDDTVSVLINQGDDAQGHAVFTPLVGSPLPLAGNPDGPVSGMTAANLTGHGDVDLVLSVGSSFADTGTCGSSPCVEVLTNSNDPGSFNPAIAYPVDGDGEVASADLRDTGVHDVLVPGGGGFQVLFNNGNGTFATPSVPYTYPGAEDPQAVAVADFNNDRKLDVAIADFDSSITVLFSGNGDGTFTYDDTVSDPGLLQSTDDALAVADLNGDCQPDLALGSDSGLIVMRNDTLPAGSACPKPAPPSTGTSGAAPPPAPMPASTRPGPSAKPHVQRALVSERIRLSGRPLTGCTTSALRLRITISVSTRAAAARSSADQHPAVKVRTVVRLDGRRIRTSARKTFVLIVPLNRVAVGGHMLTIRVTSSGPRVRSTHATRAVRFTRCAPPPRFTG